MTFKKKVLIFVNTIVPIVAVCMYLISAGYVNVTYNGFGIDSAGVLYIGTENTIEKYEDGELIGSLNPLTSRAYIFTIQNDDTILLSTASTVYNMDLSGNVLSEHEDFRTYTYNELRSSRKKFTAIDSEEYVMKSVLGRVKIMCGEDVIYQMPIIDYIVKISLIASAVSLFVFVISNIDKIGTKKWC